MIEKGRARLQRHGHAHAVDFGQNVAGQVRLTVEVQERVEWLFARRARACVAELLAGPSPLRAAGGTVGVEAALLGS